MDFAAGKSNSQRGTKRQRPPNNGNGDDDKFSASKQENQEDEIDVPLSK